MIYVDIIREVSRRLKFHSAQPNGPLAGLNIKKSGVFRIDGDKDLPQYTLIDLSATDTRGTGTGSISSFLRTARKHDWFKEEDEGPHGLYDWLELVMDAIETKPSDLTCDQLLVAHDDYGALRLDVHGRQVELLREPFVWQVNMAEISETSYTLQLDMQFSFVSTKRGARRSTPRFAL
jgi:hypothetical protein